MERFLQSLKNLDKLSLLLAALFFIGIVFSSYVLFTLPHDLVFKGGMISTGVASWVYAKLFTIITITFALGVIAINTSLKAKKEIVVFKEKKSEDETNKSTRTESGKSSIDLQAFTNAIKGAKTEKSLQMGLNSICQMLQAGQGAFYQVNSTERSVELKSAFALSIGESEIIKYEFGEGLIGQVAASGKSIYLDEVPEGYKSIMSGLGMAVPKYLYISPVKKDNAVKAILEIATFSPIEDAGRTSVDEMARLLTEKI